MSLVDMEQVLNGGSSEVVMKEYTHASQGDLFSPSEIQEFVFSGSLFAKGDA